MRQLYLVLLSMCLFSCSKFDGSIEHDYKEETTVGITGEATATGHAIYLVNNNNFKKLTFTVHEVYDDGSGHYETHTLNPGEKEFLDWSVIWISRHKFGTRDFKVVGQQEAKSGE